MLLFCTSTVAHIVPNVYGEIEIGGERDRERPGE